jgi:prepilin-type N-terminal cleavage/methylation domain-containing protein
MHLRRNREMGHLFLQRAFAGVRDMKKGFTLLELLVVLTILLILSSFGMYLYHRSLAYAKDTVCQTNLRALQQSIIFYSSENEALPGTLGELRFDHLEKGYAKAMEGRRWLVKACSLLIKFDASDHAYAHFLTYENLKKYGATEKIFHCPGDHNGGASYGINGELQGKSWSEINGHAIVVADSDSYVFHSLDQLSKRHDHKAFAAVKSGEVVEVEEEKVVAALEKEENDDDDSTKRKPWWWWPWRRH